MGTVDEPAALYDATLDLSRTAFAGRHYAVAFHTLAAALHAAYDLGDDQRLAEVGCVADEQNQWLNEHDPVPELAELAAVNRGTMGLWAMLQQEAETRRRMLAQHDFIRLMQPKAGA